MAVDQTAFHHTLTFKSPHTCTCPSYSAHVLYDVMWEKIKFSFPTVYMYKCLQMKINNLWGEKGMTPQGGERYKRT